MIIFRKTVVTLLVLTTLAIAVGFLASPATAQSPRTTVVQLPITTSTVVTVEPGDTFKTDGVQVPPCPKGTSFLATAVQASPHLIAFAGNVLSLPSGPYLSSSFRRHLTARLRLF